MTDPYPRADGRCPWFAIDKCPLYIESHVGRGLGCIDDMALRCRVERGLMSYHSGLHQLIRFGLRLNAEQLEQLPCEGKA